MNKPTQSKPILGKNSTHYKTEAFVSYRAGPGSGVSRERTPVIANPPETNGLKTPSRNCHFRFHSSGLVPSQLSQCHLNSFEGSLLACSPHFPANCWKILENHLVKRLDALSYSEEKRFMVKCLNTREGRGKAAPLKDCHTGRHLLSL